MHTFGAYIWCTITKVINIAFVYHCAMMGHIVLMFGGKGVSNLFMIYCLDINGDTKVVVSLLYHSFFLNFHTINTHLTISLVRLTTWTLLVWISCMAKSTGYSKTEEYYRKMASEQVTVLARSVGIT